MFLGVGLLYIAYLDEFGHIGPYLGRDHPKHNTSPVFGLAGVVLPYDKVRPFATFFFQLKCHLLDFEITRDNAHPATWEKKGSALYTAQNVGKYRELRSATNRYLTRIRKDGGFVFYCGTQKTRPPGQHSSKALYKGVLWETIRRLDEVLEVRNEQFMLVLDEQEDQLRHDIVTSSGRTMFGTDSRGQLIEPPIQAESHLFQTLQCADWICGLIGRYACYLARPDEYPEHDWTQKYFAQRIKDAAVCSSLRRIAG